MSSPIQRSQSFQRSQSLNDLYDFHGGGQPAPDRPQTTTPPLRTDCFSRHSPVAQLILKRRLAAQLHPVRLGAIKEAIKDNSTTEEDIVKNLLDPIRLSEQECADLLLYLTDEKQDAAASLAIRFLSKLEEQGISRISEQLLIAACGLLRTLFPLRSDSPLEHVELNRLIDRLNSPET